MVDQAEIDALEEEVEELQRVGKDLKEQLKRKRQNKEKEAQDITHEGPIKDQSHSLPLWADFALNFFKVVQNYFSTTRFFRF